MAKYNGTQASNDDKHYEMPTKGDVLHRLQDMVDARGWEYSVAHWLMDEACTHEQRPGEAPVKNRNGSWSWSYADRLIQSMQTYMQMSEQDRRILEQGVSLGVRWRGEPMKFYAGVVREHRKMQRMSVAAYRESVQNEIEIPHEP